MTTTPSVNNLLVGKGALYFTPEGGVRRHLGNVVEMELTLEFEELEHYSSLEGIKKKDLSVITQQSGSVRLVLDEWSGENVALAMLGDTSTNTDGNTVIDVFSLNTIRGRLEFIAANDVGPKIDYDFPSVAFRPSGGFSPISDEFATMEITGELETVADSFGTATIVDPNTETG